MRSDERRAAPWPRLDPARRSAEVRAYFDQRASVYDRVADRPYWAFSDRVLRALLRRALLPDLGDGKGLRLLDAGGGTGRWALHLLRELPHATAVLADVSPGMLDVARRKAARSGTHDRLALLELDLNVPLPRRLGFFDVVLCFHNVAGLVADPAALIRRLVRVTAPGGRIALVLPNLWQAAAKSLRDGRPGELGRLATRSAVRFGDDVPEVLVFTPSVARRCLKAAGCVDVTVRGFPVSVHPEGPDEDLPAHLDDPRLLGRLVPLETELCLPEEAAARGNSLLAIGRRPGRSVAGNTVRRTAGNVTKQGFDTVHAGDAGLASPLDAAIVDRARIERRTIGTLDSDVHALIALAGASSPSEIRIREKGLKGPALAELVERTVGGRGGREVLADGSRSGTLGAVPDYFPSPGFLVT